MHPILRNRLRKPHFGEVLEWLKRHAWKACNRQNRFAGSNPVLSANRFKAPRKNLGALLFSPQEEKDSKLRGTRIAQSYYVCNRKSYHRAQNMRWRWFRSNDNDEPLRYAPRTLLVIRTMKGLRDKTLKKTEKVGTIIAGLYFCKC